MARSLEIAKQMAAPNQPGPVTVVMEAWFEIEPQRAPGPMWLLESADRSRLRVVVASKTLRNARVRSADQCTSVNQRMIEADSSEALRKACQYELKTESTKERSPTELRCTSFPARL